MKIVKIILIVLASLVVIGVIVIALMPAERTIERSILVAAPAEKPFKLVNNLKNWPLWSPWYAADTTAIMVYSENAEGLGAYYTWDSKDKNIGTGKMTITTSSKPDSVIVSLEFGDWEPTSAGYYFETVGENETKVSQKMVLKADGFMGKLQIFIMDGVLNNMFDQGLAQIKTKSESMPDEPKETGKVENIGLSDLEEIMFLSYMDTVEISSMSEFFDHAYGEIMVQTGMQNLEMTGPVFAIFKLWDPEGGKTVIQCGIPVNKAGKTQGKVIYRTLPAMKVLSADFYGPYENSGQAHDALSTFASNEGITLEEAPIEFYVNDPSTVNDPMEIHTLICYPVK